MTKPTGLRIYISGPISGKPDGNRPAFAAEASRLRRLGHDVINPHELPQPDPDDWAQCMRMDIAALVTCDCIAMLPGWEHSKGASLERHIAAQLGMQVMDESQTEFA